ncbi:hypothetical protein HRW14_32805 [Streptomyces lunaelactis]|nr:hypothetical protein [Streptomyces lunaelactis]
MTLLPRTVYVVSCDGCGLTYYAAGPEDDYELTLSSSELDPAWARQMTAEGWIATARHLCPTCATARGDAAIERLELEHTHPPLFDLPIERPGPAPAGEMDPDMTEQRQRELHATALETHTDDITDGATAAAAMRFPPPQATGPDRPKTVCLCGSTRFWAELAEANLRETAAGHMVLAPGCDMKKPHPLWADAQRADELKQQLDELHRWKIRASDEVLVVNPGGYIGDSTRAEIAYAYNLGRPIRYTDPLGHSVVLTRPGFSPIRIGPYEKEHQAEEVAAGLRGQLHNTQHVEGTVIDVGDYRPELEHLDPRVPAEPYALAEAMDDDQGGDGTGCNFPDLYARLVAQEGPTRAYEVWGQACTAYDVLHSDPGETTASEA